MSGPTLASSGRTVARDDKTSPAYPSADNQAIVPYNNPPLLEAPDDSGIPDEYEFEIFRLRRRVLDLETAVLDINDRLRRALAVINDELLFWHTGLQSHVWETMGQIVRRVIRLESALKAINDVNSRFVAPLEIPKRWRK